MVGVYSADLRFLPLVIVGNSNARVRNNYFGISLTKKSKKNYYTLCRPSLQRAYKELTESLRTAHISNYKVINNKPW